MAKFPSQNRLWYETPQIGANATEVGNISLPKDLSLLNRRGYASTTRKGVPLVFRCKVDYYLQDTDGVGVSAAVGTDFSSTLHIEGCQNNWVMKNAAVKFHAAREEMFKKAGIRKKDRGAYSHEIRYNYDGASESWLATLDNDGNAFNGGTWDQTVLSYPDDNSFQVGLVGDGDDEETDAFGGGYLSIGHSYLMSRVSLPADTNPEMDEGPAKFSVLHKMLTTNNMDGAVEDDLVETARDDQDNPPYEVLDISDGGDVSHDITEPVNLGTCVASYGASHGSAIVDVPFGIMRMVARNHNTAGAITTTGTVAVSVLDIFEMQG